MERKLFSTKTYQPIAETYQPISLKLYSYCSSVNMYNITPLAWFPDSAKGQKPACRCMLGPGDKLVYSPDITNSKMLAKYMGWVVSPVHIVDCTRCMASEQHITEVQK